MGDLSYKLELLPVLIPAIIVAASLHELAHGLVGDRLGDPTPRREGRLTLNPLRHLDPIGSGMFVFTFLLFPFAFGWARPIMVQPSYFRNPKVGMGLVAIAGPLTNFLLAYGTLLFVGHIWSPGPGYWTDAVQQFLIINIILGVFNLLPIPPLDGSRIVGMFLPDQAHRKWAELDNMGAIILLVLLFVARGPIFAIINDGFALVFEFLLLLPGSAAAFDFLFGTPVGR